MEKRIMKMLFSTLFLLSICTIRVQAATFEFSQKNMTKSVISTPEDISLGLRSIVQERDYLPSIAEGYHEKWIDRVVLPDYASGFYELLEEGTDNDGNNDFLIRMENSSYIEKIKIEEESENGIEQLVDAYAVKVARIQGQGTDYDSAVEALNRDFDDKYYKIRTAQTAFDLEHSEVFWMEDSTYLAVPEFDYSEGNNGTTGTSMYTFSGDLYFVLKSPTYDIRHKAYATDELVIANIEKLNAQVEQILASAGTVDDYELIKYFNNWLTMNNEHNCETVDDTKFGIAAWYLPELFECTSALFGTVGDYGPECESYARALDVLCEKAGVPCVLVTGTVKTNTHPTGQSLVWNKVQIDGNWYAVDVAANDVIDTQNKGNPISGKESEDYLVIGSDTLFTESFSENIVRFSESHKAENRLDDIGISLVNDPVIQAERYECTIESLELVKLEFDQSIILSVRFDKADNVSGNPVYTWYKVDEYGNEIEIKGVNTNIYSFLNSLNGGTYTFRVRAALNGCIKHADVSFYIKGFSDVAKSAYYYNPVLWAIDHEITAGITANLFGPNVKCTRAQLVTFLWRFYGCPEPETTEMQFEDVAKDSYYYKAVLWGTETGIVKGWTNDMFAPDNAITRAQLATFLWRAADSPADDILMEVADVETNEFSDVHDETVFYYHAVYWAVNHNITKGYTSDRFAPDATATRAEIVTFLYRAENILLSEKES